MRHSKKGRRIPAFLLYAVFYLLLNPVMDHLGDLGGFHAAVFFK